MLKINLTSLMFLMISIFTFFAQAEKPTFESGDLIFQTSKSPQSSAIMWASQSLYSHVGMIEVSGKKIFVIEAISKVSRTPLEKWIQRGRQSLYAVYRYENLSEKNRKTLVTKASAYLGRPYDIFFTSKNTEIYCSELVELAFRQTGLSIGKMEKVKELQVNNPTVQKLVEKRWRNHPLCTSGIKSFEECWKRILEDDVITPDGLTKDNQVKKIWSNYPSNYL